MKRTINSHYKRIGDHLHALRSERAYQSLQMPATKTGPLAVIIHLYYPEMWPEFAKRLITLHEADFAFDVFVSLPPHQKGQKSAILRQWPEARVFITPNRARDVLPFIRIMKLIAPLQYEYILKLHSKKSPQRTAGSDWSVELFDKLIPARKAALEQLRATLNKPTTGVVGPDDNYLPLNVYYQDNRAGVLSILTRLYGLETARRVDEQAAEYGFFAGTMFWARVDALTPLIELNLPVRHFAAEAAQLDGTLAHAIERLASVVPELEHKQMYASDGKTIKKIAYEALITQDEWNASANNKT